MKNYMTFSEFKKFKMNEEESEEFEDVENDSPEEESEEEKERGCLMAYFDIPNWDELIAQVSPDDVYGEPPRFGIETEPHTTILFGFDLETTNPDDIVKAIEDLKVEPITDIEIKDVDKFENDEYDVLKLTIESATLRELNEYFMENFDYENEYPEYNPHITIAYLEKGKADDYLDLDYSVLTDFEDDADKDVDIDMDLENSGEDEKKNPLESSVLVYSDSQTDQENNNKTMIDLFPRDEESDLEGDDDLDVNDDDYQPEIEDLDKIELDDE